jgi:16S rRNA G966 N2-methylase RsmD
MPRKPHGPTLLDTEEQVESDRSAVVECLGLTFPTEAARRAYFTERLREKLLDPEFRRTEGFPLASDEDILRLSDPPFYTACPNPFLADFVRCYGRAYDPDERYQREPFAVDVSVGKTDALYKAHGYHTKVPHLAIVPSILHYTRPGDIVLDAFAGSGMTGVAAQWCGTAPAAYRHELEAQWKRDGRGKPQWGARRVILNDLGPAATFMAAGYNLPFDVKAFAKAAQRILDEVEHELGWMYQTTHTDGQRKGRINYTVWSEVFTCPECTAAVVFLEQALDRRTKRVKDEFPCPNCRAALNKDTLERLFVTGRDLATGKTWKRIRLVPVLVNYDVERKEREKQVTADDIALLARIEALPLPSEVPSNPFPLEEMYHGSRLGPKGFTHIHHLFLPRQAQALAALWRKASCEPDTRLRNALLFSVEQAIWGMSLLARYAPTHYSQVNQYLNGVYYIGSQVVDVSPWYILAGKLERLVKSFSRMTALPREAAIATGTCAATLIPSGTIDYVFTDPPFGENIYYADLNFLVESWHRVLTNSEPEAIVDQAKHKGLHEYQDLMRRCFAEYCRVLKPGRWMTVVFSNSSNAVWRAIQEAMGTAGFVVADVRTLDKQQGSYRQVTSSAVKQDLVISAYKPTEALTGKFHLETATEESAWAFVQEHLRNVPVFVGEEGTGEVIGERTAQMLHDRMIAFHVQRGVAVPVSGPEFEAGLRERFVPRDGMFFLPNQVAEYDKKRTKVSELRQLDLFVTDEASAIKWVRQQLSAKPRTLQDLTPAFTRELQVWERHERQVELRDILRDNFVQYDGDGPVPPQIHAYLSHSYSDLRNLPKQHPRLVAKARGRWYVPDPGKATDLEKMRQRALLREFETYRSEPSRKLKTFRTEAIRAGFKAAYDARDYQTIVDVAGRLPDKVLQEDETLLMYYDVASLRLGV